MYTDILSKIGDLTTLAGLDKLYGVDSNVTTLGEETPGIVQRGNTQLAPALRWNTRIPDALPKVLVAKPWNEFRIAIGENMAANPPKSTELILGVLSSKMSDWVEVKVNRALITPPGGVHPDANGMYRCPVDPNLIGAGVNSISVLLDVRGPSDRNPRSLAVLDLAATYQ